MCALWVDAIGWWFIFGVDLALSYVFHKLITMYWIDDLHPSWDLLELVHLRALLET